MSLSFCESKYKKINNNGEVHGNSYTEFISGTWYSELEVLSGSCRHPQKRNILQKRDREGSLALWKGTGSSHKQEGGALAGRGEGIFVQLWNKHTLQALKTVTFYVLRDDSEIMPFRAKGNEDKQLYVQCERRGQCRDTKKRWSRWQMREMVLTVTWMKWLWNVKLQGHWYRI